MYIFFYLFLIFELFHSINIIKLIIKCFILDITLEPNDHIALHRKVIFFYIQTWIKESEFIRYCL
jgi:hypothetical protein